MGEGTNLEMDLFDSDLELNLDTGVPEENIVDHTTNTEENIVPPIGISNTTTKDGKVIEQNKNLGEVEAGNTVKPESVAEDESTTEEGDTDNTTSPNFYSSVATVLKEQGLLPSLDVDNTDIKSIDDFTEAFKKEIDNQKFEGLTDLQKEALASFESGIDPKDFVEYKNTEEQLNNITEDNIISDIELAKTVIFQDLVNQGVTEKTATKIVKRTTDLGEESIVADAIESLDNVKAFNKKMFQKKQDDLNKQKLAEIDTQKTFDISLKNSIYKTESIIDGINLDKNIKDKIYNSITKIIGRSPSGVPENKLMQDRRNDPIGFDTKMYYLFELTDGFKDFSKIITSSKSNAIKDLENLMRDNPSLSDGTSSDYSNDSQSYVGLGDELNI